MKIKNYSDVSPTLFDDEPAKGVKARVLIGNADGAKNFCMRIFEIEKNGYTPRHSHDWEHEVFIPSGSGQLYSEGEWVPVKSGQAVFIPGNEEHQFKNTGDEPFIMICLVPSSAPEL